MGAQFEHTTLLNRPKRWSLNIFALTSHHQPSATPGNPPANYTSMALPDKIYFTNRGVRLTKDKSYPNINNKSQNSQQKSGFSADVSSVSIPKKLRRQLYFSRNELSIILAAYSARVAGGEWRDYALDHMNGVALFSIFRHTHDAPLFVIEKKQRHPKEKPQFILRDRSRVLCRSNSVNDVTGYFNKLPRLVTG